MYEEVRPKEDTIDGYRLLFTKSHRKEPLGRELF
jgi:hypothetical protein